MSLVRHDGNSHRSASTRLFTAFLLATAFIAVFTIPATAQVPTSQHIVLVIEENTSLTTARANFPWLVQEATANAWSNNYVSNTSGSLMDYLWLASGSCHSSANCTLISGRTHDFGCNGNDCTSPITDDNIFRQMNSHTIPWKVYAQSYDAAAGCTGCGVPTTPDNGHSTSYYRRHNGATWYSDILNDKTQWSKIVDFSKFSTDLANNALPRYTIIVPDGAHDAHDGTAPSKYTSADNFLNSTLTPLLAKSWFQPGGDGLLIITFDNGDGDIAGKVFTVMIGPKVKSGLQSSVAYQHQNLLRTMMDALGVADYPGASQSAVDMNDFFNAGGGTSGVVISNPTTVPQISSPVPFNATATSNGLPITAMKVYLDGNPTEIATFNGDGSSKTLIAHSAFTMAAGTHTFNVNAWDTGNTIYQSQITFTVSSTGMAVGAPGNNNQITGGTPFQATATGTANITAMKVYLDFDTNPFASYNGNNTTQLSESDVYSLGIGPHTLIVNAWDTTGKVYQSSEEVNVSATGTVINAPGSGAQISGMVPFQATATSNGANITAMNVYEDFNSTPIATYTGNSTSSLSETANFSMANGSHIVIVNAWDANGQIYQSAVQFTVSSTGVVVTSPAVNATVTSPVNFSATATSSGGAVITAMNVYLDYNSTPIGSYNGNGTSSFNETTTYTIASGSHTLIVNAWDASGNLYQSAVPFTVQ